MDLHTGPESKDGFFEVDMNRVVDVDDSAAAKDVPPRKQAVRRKVL